MCATAIQPERTFGQRQNIYVQNKTVKIPQFLCLSILQYMKVDSVQRAVVNETV